MLIGRSPEAVVQLHPERDSGVSSRHALIVPTATGWAIRDLASRNGTLLNGRRIMGEADLTSGDRIGLGPDGPVLVFDPGPGDIPTPLPIPATAESGADGTAPGFGGSGKPPPLAAVGLWGGGLLVVILLGWWGLASPPPPTSIRSAPVDEAVREEPDAAPESGRPSGAVGPDLAELQDELRRTRAERDALRRAQESPERSRPQADSDSEELRRRLQDAEAAVRRQQFAGVLDFDRLRAQVEGSVVQIYAQYGASGRGILTATGFVVGGEGQILTNRHVVRSDGQRPTRIAVRLPGESAAASARVVAVSITDDVALLQAAGLAGAPFLSDLNLGLDSLAPGVPVVAFGYPLGGTQDQGGDPAASRPLPTAGLLEAHARGEVWVEGYGAVGSSGSPIVDRDGRVLGLVRGGDGEGSDRRVVAVSAAVLAEFLGEHGLR